MIIQSRQLNIYTDNSTDLQNLQPQLTRKHISQARYEVRLPIFIGQPFYKFIFLKEVSTDEKHLFQCASGTTRYKIPFPLKPAKKYEINVFCGSCDGPGRFTLVAHPPLKFQAGIWRCIYKYMWIMFCFICLICHACIKMIMFDVVLAMDKSQLTLLYNRAIEFCNDRRSLHRRIHFLYRNKPHQYFDKIRSQNGGIMTKYIKNDGGDQASPLNRAIQGLFFSAFFLKTPDGQFILPPDSPFGDQRFHVAVPFFLNSKNNLYFADFFCHYTNHHVTLVVTEANSYSDKFCKENLIFLESFNNPFLYYNRSKHCFFINTSVNVEVFYTENINIGKLLSWGPKYAFFTFCDSVGDSRTKSFIGQSKNKDCDICNLNSL